MKILPGPVPCGFLNINKPPRCSSRDVVNQVQRLVRPVKVGHAGTLDPLATGVLVVAVGNATRLIQFVHELPKSYIATFQFGCQSLSDDFETDVVPIAIPDSITRTAIEQSLRSFLGPIRQRPPMYSAVKVEGRRAYRLARKGIHRDLAERTIVIHDAKVLSWDRPLLQVELTCSTGTYIRAIGRDLAEKLGTSAVMTALTRTTIGPFHIHDSVPPDAVTADSLSGQLGPSLCALGQYAKYPLSDSEVIDVQYGRPIRAATPWAGEGTVATVAGTDAQGELVAVLQLRPDNRYWPICVFPPAGMT